MTLTTDDLIAALRLRYDYYSAQTMLDSALANAGIAPKAAYDAAEIAAFRAALSRVGDRLNAVDARLDALAGSPAPAQAAAAEPVAKAAAAEPIAKAAAAEPVAKAAAAEPIAKAAAAGPVAKAAAAEPVAKAAAAEPIAKAAAAEPIAKAAATAPVDPTAKAAPVATAPVEPNATAASAATAPVEPIATAAPAAAEPVATSATIETVITLTGVPVDEDEQVLVCGGLPELGDWDVTRARPMVREGDRWLTTLELAADTEAPFKFVRCAADGSATWEAGDNRSLVAVPSIVTSWQ